MIPLLKKFSRNEAGVSAVEFALILVPLLLLIFGIIEFGRAFQIRNEIERSLDIVARDFEVRNYRVFGNPGECSAKRTNIESYFENEIRTGSNSAVISSLDRISVAIECDIGDHDNIKVTANYQFSPMIAFFDVSIIDLSVVRLASWPSNPNSS